MFKKLFMVLLVLIMPNTVTANEISIHKIELNFYYRDSVELRKGKVEEHQTHVVVIEGYCANGRFCMALNAASASLI